MYGFDFFVDILHYSLQYLYTSARMFKGLNASFEEVLFLTDQKVPHCIYDF